MNLFGWGWSKREIDCAGDGADNDALNKQPSEVDSVDGPAVPLCGVEQEIVASRATDHVGNAATVVSLGGIVNPRRKQPHADKDGSPDEDGNALALAHACKTPNDPKLSDRGGWRECCAAGLLGAALVTAVAVRCSAWLGVLALCIFAFGVERTPKCVRWDLNPLSVAKRTNLTNWLASQVPAHAGPYRSAKGKNEPPCLRTAAASRLLRLTTPSSATSKGFWCFGLRRSGGLRHTGLKEQYA